MSDIHLEVDEPMGVSLSFGEANPIPMRIGAPVYSPTIYHGAYTVTPSEEEQSLPTENAMLRQDVVVAPIPSNYGRIEWDGTSILVY